MVSKRFIKKGLLNCFIIFTFVFNSILPVKAQGDFVSSSRIGGGSSVYVFRTSRKAKKRTYLPKRRTKAKRTRKQRRVTRRKIVRQSRRVAKKNRRRRKIKKITPKQLEEIKIATKTAAEASKILAGAGEYYVEKDDSEKAVGFLEEAVELDDTNNDAKLALSEVYTSLGDSSVDKAEEFAQKAAAAVKANNEADVQKYLTQEKFSYQKAEREFKRAIELDPRNSSAYASLGQYFDNKGDDVKAKENYETALSIDSDFTRVKAPLGIIFYQEGMIDKSEKYISEALASDPNNPEVQYFLGLIRYSQNRNDEAKTALEASIVADNDNAEAHYYLAATLARLGNEDRAINEYLITTTLNPKFVSAWFDLGVAYYNKGMYEKALAAFDKAIKLNMNQTTEDKRIYAESFANMAETYRQTGRYGAAISRYRNAVDLINDPELYSTYGFVLAREERWLDAVKMFEKVTQINPDAVSFANLGWVHYQESEYQKNYRYFDKQKTSLRKAKSALQTAISKDSNFAAPYLNLGNTLNDLGEYDSAVSILRKAVKLKPKWVVAETELGTAYRNKKDYGNAVKQFKKAISIDNRYAYAYYGLGEAEFTRGKMKEAKKAHKRLKELNAKLAGDLERKISKGIF